MAQPAGESAAQATIASLRRKMQQIESGGVPVVGASSAVVLESVPAGKGASQRKEPQRRDSVRVAPVPTWLAAHLPGGGVARAEFTFVLNVVEALVLATEQPALESGAVFNITNHEAQSLALILEMLLGQQLGIQYYLRAAPYQVAYGRAGLHELGSMMRRQPPRLTRHGVATAVYDLTLSRHRARNTLNYMPRYALAEGMALTAQWMIAQGLVTPR